MTTAAYEVMFATVAILALGFLGGVVFVLLRHDVDPPAPPPRDEFTAPDFPPIDWPRASEREDRLLDRVADLEEALRGSEAEKAQLYESLEERNERIADLRIQLGMRA